MAQAWEALGKLDRFQLDRFEMLQCVHKETLYHLIERSKRIHAKDLRRAPFERQHLEMQGDAMHALMEKDPDDAIQRFVHYLTPIQGGDADLPNRACVCLEGVAASLKPQESGIATLLGHAPARHHAARLLVKIPNLDVALLTPYKASVAGMIGHADACVRNAAIVLLAKIASLVDLGPALLTPHVSTLKFVCDIESIDDGKLVRDDESVDGESVDAESVDTETREAAVVLLAKFEALQVESLATAPPKPTDGDAMAIESVVPAAAPSKEEEDEDEDEDEEEEDSEAEAHENAKKSHLDRDMRQTVRDAHREFQPGGAGHEALVEAYVSHPLFQAADSPEQPKAVPSAKAGKRRAAASKGPKAKVPRTVDQSDVELVKKTLIPDETATKGRWASEIFAVMVEAGFKGSDSELGDVMKEAFGSHEFVKKTRDKKGMKWSGLTNA